MFILASVHIDFKYLDKILIPIGCSPNLFRQGNSISFRIKKKCYQHKPYISS